MPKRKKPGPRPRHRRSQNMAHSSPLQTLEEEEEASDQHQTLEEAATDQPHTLEEEEATDQAETLEETATDQLQTLEEAYQEEGSAAESIKEVEEGEQESNELGEEIKEQEKFEEEEQEVPHPGISVPDPRRRSRRKPITEAQRAFAQQKLALLQENFTPAPFKPRKTVDFAAHEELFRALNLWEFVNLDFDTDIRTDLLILLIANYDRSQHRSFVGNVEISVSRLDLACSLKLPLEVREVHEDIFANEASKEVIEQFLSNYILLEDEDEDDMCILPEELVAVNQLVKAGHANKVDWAELMWALVEKELLEAPRLSYHYASHLQCLMKFQKSGLFEKEEGMGAVPVPEPDSSLEVSDSMDEDDVGDEEVGGGSKMRTLDEFGDAGLRLEIGENGDLMNGIEDFKGTEEGGPPDGCKDEGFQHCLRRCSSNEARSMEFENLCKVEQIEREDEFPNLERLTSTDLLHTMDPRMNPLEQSTGDFVSMGVDGNRNASVDIGPSDSLFYENNGKRHIDNVDVDEDECGGFRQDNQQKRMRCGELWEERAPSGFDSYMEQIQCTMRKARMLYVEKEQACLDGHLHLQYLNEIIEQKDQIIHSLEKTQVEEHQRWQHTVQEFERELNSVAGLVVGYKQALKETQKNFEEYRKKCPQGDVTLYRDVPGSGGLVLTSRELEKLRVEKEEEMRQIAEEMISAFNCEWLVKFEDYKDAVMVLHRRLVELEGNIELMKETFAERKDVTFSG
ncbi:uncharacterized protein LOC109828818 isoform X2 [Asparagus officinalis]|uniref:uncharacterized protein LOC109828818 isoform X2 n=1 Tax=Asparagus officinalis TaxID=4686 RepID=UPI00098E7373|nr:uncharacterized protein LOC109828818 isoform X2 [Asparagus officinalis]